MGTAMFGTEEHTKLLVDVVRVLWRGTATLSCWFVPVNFLIMFLMSPRKEKFTIFNTVYCLVMALAGALICGVFVTSMYEIIKIKRY